MFRSTTNKAIFAWSRLLRVSKRGCHGEVPAMLSVTDGVDGSLNGLNDTLKRSEQLLQEWKQGSSINTINLSHEIDNAFSKLHEFPQILKKLEESLHEVESSLTPDASNYKEWSINQIIGWIETLENGRFLKYISKLRSGFVVKGIRGDTLPQFDLKFIDDGKDKNDLEKHFRQLCLSNNKNKNLQDFIQHDMDDDEDASNVHQVTKKDSC